MNQLYREPTEQEFLGYCVKILQFDLDALEKIKPGSKYLDKMAVCEYINTKRPTSVIIADTYWFTYDVGVGWNHAKPLLYEISLFKLNDSGKGTMKDVVDAMIALAKKHGAVGIVTATMLAKSNRALSRIYERYGFKTVSHEMFLEVTP